MNKRSNNMRRLCIVGVILLTAFVVYIRSAFSCTTRDVERYIEYVSELDIEDTNSGFILYPKSDLAAKDIITAYYNERGGLFDTSYQMYMECQYDERSYYKEIERIQQISIESNQLKQTPLYTSEGFLLPAYVGIYLSDGEAEYVLMDDENYTISYVITDSSTLTAYP